MGPRPNIHNTIPGKPGPSPVVGRTESRLALVLQSSFTRQEARSRGGSAVQRGAGRGGSQSELMEAAAAAPPERDTSADWGDGVVALGFRVKASSRESPSQKAGNLLEADLRSHWSTATNTKEWILLELQVPICFYSLFFSLFSQSSWGSNSN